MKILVVDQYRDVGGGQTVFLQAIGCLLNAGHQVSAAFPLGGSLERAVRDRFGNAIVCHDVPEPRLTIGRKTPLDALRLASHSAGLLRLTPLLSRADYVYVNGARLFPAFLVLASVVRARFVYHVHLDHSGFEKRIIGALIRHPRTHAVLVNSGFVHRRLVEKLGAVAEHPRVRVVENGLDREYSALPFVDRWPSADRLNVVTIGRLIPEKGHDVVVDLARSLPDVAFHIIGDSDGAPPEFANALRARAGSNVIFHGRVDKLISKLDELRAHVNLVPSRREESFGLVAVEGMACSCITITSGQGGLADIAARTGSAVADSPEAWAHLVGQIRETTAAANAACARAQFDAVKRYYGYERFEREFTAVFESVGSRS